MVICRSSLGSARVRARGRRGFTLIEILLALALMALLAGAIVGVSLNVVGDRPKAPADFFWLAVDKSIHRALKSGLPAQLRYDEREGAFVIRSGDGGEQRIPVTSPLAPTFQLLRDAAGGTGTRSSVLIGGRLVETSPLPFVTFYPDGTCAPFRLQIVIRGEQPTILAIDPWTCAEMLVTDPNNPNRRT